MQRLQVTVAKWSFKVLQMMEIWIINIRLNVLSTVIHSEFVQVVRSIIFANIWSSFGILNKYLGISQKRISNKLQLKDNWIIPLIFIWEKLFSDLVILKLTTKHSSLWQERKREREKNYLDGLLHGIVVYCWSAYPFYLRTFICQIHLI